MNYATQQNDTRCQEKKSNENSNQATEVLEFFAEELPTQRDLKPGQTSATIATISSISTTTTGTVSTLGTLGCLG